MDMDKDMDGRVAADFGSVVGFPPAPSVGGARRLEIFISAARFATSLFLSFFPFNFSPLQQVQQFSFSCKTYAIDYFLFFFLFFFSS